MVHVHGRPAAARRSDGPALGARAHVVLDSPPGGLPSAPAVGDAPDLRSPGAGRGLLGSAVRRIRSRSGRPDERTRRRRAVVALYELFSVIGAAVVLLLILVIVITGRARRHGGSYGAGA